MRLSNRVTVPGCHAMGFIAAVYPLVRIVRKGILPNDAPVKILKDKRTEFLQYKIELFSPDLI